MEIGFQYRNWIFSIILFPKRHFLLGIWYEPVMESNHIIKMLHIGFAFFWIMVRKYEKAH